MSPVQKRKRSKSGLVKRRPQKCVFCGKVLQNYCALEMHMNSHTRERPWECSHCDATFMSYGVLIVHRNNIHYGKKFKCNVCNRLFNIASHLYTHRKRVHPHVEAVGGKRRKRGIMCGGRRMRIFSAAVAAGRIPGKRGRPRKNTNHVSRETSVNDETSAPRNFDEVVDEEELRRKTVEIESNPGTPIMTVRVNVLSKDADVVSKLKLPMIKIKRLPDGVWKQKIVTRSSCNSDGEDNSPSINEHETENESGGGDEYDDEDERETEPEEGEEEQDIFVNHQFAPSSPTAAQPSPSPPLFPSLLPHQIPPLPPFNLVFPGPFPFKLHNFTVDYLGTNGSSNHNQQHPQQQPPQQLQQQQQSCWDTSFFLHLNRYKPEDSCYHPDAPKTADSSQKSPIRSTLSYQYVSKFPRKQVLRKQKKPLLKKELKVKKKKKVQQQPTSKTVITCRVSELTASTKAEKEELIEETETGVFTCKECGKEFHIRWNLLTHLMTHTGEKPFGCCFCQMRFRQKAHMIKHIASIHRFKDEKPPAPVKGKGKVSEKDDFSCGFCGEVFEIKLALIKHISQLHGDKLTDSV